MRFGLTTPIVTLAATSHAAWEIGAGPAEIRRIAVAADRLGYHHMTCSEHVAIPMDVVPTRGGRYYDALATLAWIAAATERIRLVTHVVVLPYHHPLAVAKSYGTLDALSGGRVVLGVGVGSLEPEFRLLGVDFAGRGPRYEDALRALRAALGRREPAYEGTHYRFDGFVVDPCAVQPRVPIWLGGKTERSLRRALSFGDGWDPFYLTVEELKRMLARARQWEVWRARHERAEPFDLVFSPEEFYDVTLEEGRAAMTALLRRYQTIGATVLSLRFRSSSCDHFLDQLEIFAREIAPQFA
ncbi:MAG TPA: TIGR03619 family F420-dependent LLM class oxidoreductase [Candidatus Binatia bacterium]|nr:TIGR03619 family F420-dependent LLM class oxidoreductase [Candidatus Binatia bacterium]